MGEYDVVRKSEKEWLMTDQSKPLSPGGVSLKSLIIAAIVIFVLWILGKGAFALLSVVK
ncbi:MAG: hypothetical protein KBD07_03590 [Candidatus Omnitrophica bacterium]|jgi:hypothetical protein|nr:hypothetical protein [Candidatus Omnitrophota bacterium]